MSGFNEIRCIDVIPTGVPPEALRRWDEVEGTLNRLDFEFAGGKAYWKSCNPVR